MTAPPTTLSAERTRPRGIPNSKSSSCRRSTDPEGKPPETASIRPSARLRPVPRTRLLHLGATCACLRSAASRAPAMPRPCVRRTDHPGESPFTEVKWPSVTPRPKPVHVTALLLESFGSSLRRRDLNRPLPRRPKPTLRGSAAMRSPCSTLVVLHHPDGLLRPRCAGLLHPAANHGIRLVSHPLAVAAGMPTAPAPRVLPEAPFGPLEEFPSPAAVRASPPVVALLALPQTATMPPHDPLDRPGRTQSCLACHPRSRATRGWCGAYPCRRCSSQPKLTSTSPGASRDARDASMSPYRSPGSC